MPLYELAAVDKSGGRGGAASAYRGNSARARAGIGRDPPPAVLAGTMPLPWITLSGDLHPSPLRFAPLRGWGGARWAQRGGCAAAGPFGSAREESQDEGEGATRPDAPRPPPLCGCRRAFMGTDDLGWLGLTKTPWRADSVAGKA